MKMVLPFTPLTKKRDTSDYNLTSTCHLSSDSHHVCESGILISTIFDTFEELLALSIVEEQNL